MILWALAATWLIWGSTYLVIRFALVGFAPYFMMATRFVCAGAVLLGWQMLRGASLPTLTEWRNAFLVGALMLGGGMGGVAYAEQTIASALVVSFIAVTPLLLVAINLVFRIYPRPSELLAVFVGLAGVLLLTQGAAPLFSCARGYRVCDRNARRWHRAAGDVCTRRRVVALANAGRRLDGLVVSRGIWIADCVQRLHAVARSHLAKPCRELFACESAGCPRSRRDAGRRTRDQPGVLGVVHRSDRRGAAVHRSAAMISLLDHLDGARQATGVAVIIDVSK
jgi:EamA-like transporter family